MRKELYITLCATLPCCIIGIQWYKNDMLFKAQQHHEQLQKTQQHLLRQKTELELQITVAYDSIKQFAAHELKMTSKKKEQIRMLPS